MRGSELLILPPMLILSLMAVSLTGCSHLGIGAGAPPTIEVELSPQERLDLALESWRGGNYGRAALELSHLATDPPTPSAGAEARLLLALLELDPRNQERETSIGAALAAELLSDSTVSPTVSSLGEVVYLLAREIGAPEPADTSTLPKLPGIPLANRLDTLQGELEQRVEEIERLRDLLRERDAEVARLERELERIRKALRP